MECHFYKNRIQDYFDGQLDEIEERELEAHAAYCESCAEDLAEMEALFIGLLEMPPVKVDASFSEEVLAAIDVQRYRVRPRDVLGEVFRIPGQVMPAPARLGVALVALAGIVGAAFGMGFYGRLVLAETISFGGLLYSRIESGLAFVGNSLGRLGESLALLRPLIDMIESALQLGTREASGNIALVGLLIFTLSSVALATFVRRSGRPTLGHVRLF